ncbi:heterokaryon incompatibility protein-domain-containing protein [Paraphoma chrysanthemicola]|nr:heterokaryon incompatibility protein-domain-containing protein [Paraphoma chrysanthemicola]
MVLCQPCQGITVNSIVVYIDSEDESRSTYGYAHQPTYGALARSAAICALCNLFVHALELANAGRDIPEAVKENKKSQLWLLAGTDAFFNLQSPKDLSSMRINVGHGGLVKPADVSITALPDDPLAMSGDVIGRRVDIERHPSEMFLSMKKWFRTCVEGHTFCKTASMVDEAFQPLPKRVIDVGTDGSSLLRLFPSSGALGQYAALSYCWGKAQTFTTTAETFAQRCRGFTLEMLPQTIRDAVVVTRQLCLRYLWVDAICIIQGDLADWVEESSKMAQVYGNAAITISATCSPDTITGLFRKRWSTDRGAVTLKSMCSSSDKTGTMFISAKLGSVSDALDGAVLNTRAWCLQERVLSRRIIHFAQDQMYWECQEQLYAEDGLVVPSSSGLKQSLRSASSDPWQTVVRNWHIIVDAYSRRNLSHLSDKLPAISGLARIIHDQKKAEYLAGFWREDLPFALLWFADSMSDTTTQPATQWRAPSWSWASLDGPISSQGNRANVVTFEAVIDQAIFVSCNLTNKRGDAFGELVAGSLKLKTRMRRGRRNHGPKEFDYGGWKGNLTREHQLVDEQGVLIGGAFFDSSVDQPPMEFDCVQIATGIMSTGEVMTYCLLVSLRKPEGWTRIGVGSVNGQYFEGEETVEVTLY